MHEKNSFVFIHFTSSLAFE
uniref:Uncharacterized protein n=1 Tax=Anguilla anguilla TaxID=7936 RepID=A0A0E9XSP6_ANGAN